AAPHRARHSFPTRRSSDLRSFYPDAAGTHQHPFQHLLSFTGSELRNPSPHINLKSFSEMFPSDDVHPLVHYALHADRLLKHSDRSEEHTSELQSQSNLVCR